MKIERKLKKGKLTVKTHRRRFFLLEPAGCAGEGLLLVSPLPPLPSLSFSFSLPPSPPPLPLPAALLVVVIGHAIPQEGSRSPFPQGVLRIALAACASFAPFQPPKLATARKAPSQAQPASTKSRTIGQQVLSLPKAAGPRQGPAPA